MSIILDHVNCVYGEGTNMEVHALKDINLVIPDGQFIGLIGHTGSGKSTLVQHLNGLVKASSGDLLFLLLQSKHSVLKCKCHNKNVEKKAFKNA